MVLEDDSDYCAKNGALQTGVYVFDVTNTNSAL